MAYIHGTCLVCISLFLLSKNSSLILFVCLFFVCFVGFLGKGSAGDLTTDITYSGVFNCTPSLGTTTCIW